MQPNGPGCVRSPRSARTATLPGRTTRCTPSRPTPIRQAPAKAGRTISDLDLIEINEAFVIVAIRSMRDLNVGHDKVNVTGGAIALSHQLGACGARIALHLCYELGRRGGLGAAGMCGGGQGEALLLRSAGDTSWLAPPTHTGTGSILATPKLVRPQHRGRTPTRAAEDDVRTLHRCRGLGPSTCQRQAGRAPEMNRTVLAPAREGRQRQALTPASGGFLTAPFRVSTGPIPVPQCPTAVSSDGIALGCQRVLGPA